MQLLGYRHLRSQSGAIMSEAALAMTFITIVVFISSIALVAIFRTRESQSHNTMEQVGPCSVCEPGRMCIKDNVELCPPTYAPMSLSLGNFIRGLDHERRRKPKKIGHAHAYGKGILCLT